MTFSKNPIVDGLQHLAHWLKIGVKDTIGAAVVTIHRGVVVSDDMKEQFPTLADETATVAGNVLQCKTLAAAVALSVAAGGVNLAADAGVLAALVTDGPALVELFTNAGKLLKTAAGDIAQDTRDLAGKSPAASN